MKFKDTQLLIYELEKAVNQLVSIRDQKNLIEKELKLDEHGNGSHTIYYGNGTIFVELSYENYKKNGPIKSYHYTLDFENKSHGSLRVECNFVNDLYHGYMKRYHENGKLALEVNMVNGEKDGVYKDYYESGNLRNLEFYILGKKHGTMKTFHDWEPSGKLLKCESECVNGKFHGPCIYYLLNGVLQKEGYYVEDKVHGLCKYYDEKGILINTKLYENGICIEEKDI
jgi:antitoxin component YwqK of YwqJK toxin-antitoxin module